MSVVKKIVSSREVDELFDPTLASLVDAILSLVVHRRLRSPIALGRIRKLLRLLRYLSRVIAVGVHRLGFGEQLDRFISGKRFDFPEFLLYLASPVNCLLNSVSGFIQLLFYFI